MKNLGRQLNIKFNDMKTIVENMQKKVEGIYEKINEGATRKKRT